MPRQARLPNVPDVPLAETLRLTAAEGMQFWDPPRQAKPKVIGICASDGFGLQ